MQISDLQAMTVVQLRKLAKENGIKLRAGIDKEGIVEKISQELSGAAPASVVEAQAVAPAQFDQEQKSEEKPVSAETTPDFGLSVDVTSAPRPGTYGGYPSRASEHQEEGEGGYRPAYRQAWQARSQNRDTAPRPSWQTQQTRTGANRFGPQNRNFAQRQEEGDGYQPRLDAQHSPETHARMENDGYRQAYQAPSQDNRNQEMPQQLDGYRLGYRAAPQRPAYQNREQNYGYRQNHYGSNAGYRPNQQGYGYRPANNYGGYQQRTPESNGNDGIYRMQRDPQFDVQMEAGQVPDLMQLHNAEPAKGMLEVLPDGYGFLRSETLVPGRNDVYVSVAQIRRFDLRTGDVVEGMARSRRESDKYAALLTVGKINGKEPDEKTARPAFEQLVPIYPDKRIVLESLDNPGNMVIRLVDLIAPIGFGQRAMIVTPDGADGLSILRDVSCAIKRNDKDAEVLMLLIDIAPEDVTIIRETADAEVFASTFADAPETQTRVSENMLERAMRLVENGKNVVILLDSLTKLTRAYQAAQAQNGRPVSNTVTPSALVRPKRFFGAARNTRDGGSLTVVATIATNTGSRVDDIVFEEFKGTANMELTLCAPASGDPIAPMIDLQRSGTKKDGMLLDERRMEGLRSIRQVLGSTTNGEAVVQLIDMMQKTKCNEDLLAKLQEWMVLWEKSGYLKR
ncbi:MAG: transcription termination factor Rho [Clostridia bacterium]|nr:transcription termination factor Rho [Clostridia bacterium]MBP3651135.1 transcription termination factor Rho [Clostridia bacterium]